MLSREFLTERGYCCGLGCLMCPYIPKHIKGNTVMNKKDILIVSALEVETQGQLENWKPHNLLYTGVGKVNATYNLTKRLQVDKSINYDARINLVINYGTAGSRKIKKKTLVDCTKFVQRDMDVMVRLLIWKHMLLLKYVTTTVFLSYHLNILQMVLMNKHTRIGKQT